MRRAIGGNNRHVPAIIPTLLGEKLPFTAVITVERRAACVAHANMRHATALVSKRPGRRV